MTDRNGFSDANGRTVRPPDEVQYQFGARHGELIEAYSDGDAYVRFFDNPQCTELVKWKHLCGVPEEFKVAPSPETDPPHPSTLKAGEQTMKDVQPTPRMLAFLDRLAPHSEPVTRTVLGCVTSKDEERARAACRRLGLAKFHRLSPAKPLGWSITQAGRKARILPPAGGR